MKIAAQASAELTHLAKLIEDLPVAMLTTADDTGAMTSRPMSLLEMDASGTLWFFTDVRSPKVAHLQSVNLSFADTDRSTYVSISGRCTIDSDRERITRLWTNFARPWFPEGPDSPTLALLAVEPRLGEYWDAPDSRMVRTLSMAASIVAGKPVGMGEHEKLTRLAPSGAVSA